MSEHTETIEELHDVLQRNGFVRCDIAACNCGSWHARYGYRQRLEEVTELVTDAGHPLTNENGHLIKLALSELIAERDSLRAVNAELLEALEAYEAWADKTICTDVILKRIREQIRAAIASARKQKGEA